MAHGVDTGRITHDPEMHRRVAWKDPVRVATTANGVLATAFEAGDTVDGVVLALYDPILLRAQTDATENGIYVVQASGAPLRRYDMDDSNEFVGAVVRVLEGTANGGKVFVCTSLEPFVIDDDDATFAEFPTPAAASAPVDATYLVKTANGTLTNEEVVGATPGGELGGTWASPTVDATHSGSAHSDFVAKADDLAVMYKISGGGAAPSTGIKGNGIYWPFAGHVRAVLVTGSVAGAMSTGSCVLDIWKGSYADYLAGTIVVGDSITASAKPTVTTARASKDTTLTGWTTAFSPDDFYLVNLDSVSGFTDIDLILVYDKT